MQIDRPITIGLILFVILLLIFFLVAPEYKNFVQLRTDLGEKKAEFNAEFDYYNAIASIHDQLIAHQEEIKKIDEALPQDPDLSKIIYYLQKSGKDNGLIVKDLFLAKSSPVSAKASTTATVKDIVFSMSLSGDYPSLENFILSLEKSSRIFEVISISFGSVAKPPYNFSLQIKTHSY